MGTEAAFTGLCCRGLQRSGRLRAPASADLSFRPALGIEPATTGGTVGLALRAQLLRPGAAGSASPSVLFDLPRATSTAGLDRSVQALDRPAGLGLTFSVAL